MPFFNASLTEIDEKETRRYAGLQKADFSDAAIHRACLEAQILSQPKAVWNLYDYNAANHMLNASFESVLLEGNSIRRHLHQAKQLLAICVTIGESIENTIHDHFKTGDYAHSLLLDAAATTAVETAADALENAIRPQFAKQGLAFLARFSPGYGDFDIRFQSKLLQLSQAESIGVQMTESYMLMPRKSITALIGLVPAKQAPCPPTHENCKTCQQKNCLSRKESYHDKAI